MSNRNSFGHKNRFRTAAQWIQALTTLGILLILYLSRNLFGGGELAAQVPSTPPIGDVQQVSYWNEGMGFGFRGENEDKYQNQAFSGGEVVAVDPQE